MSLPYDVVIDPSGVWFGPSGTEAKSEEWYHWLGGVAEFFDVILRPDFALHVTVWRVSER